MTEAKIFTPENPLSEILDHPDAPLASELVAGSNRRLAAVGEKLRAHVEEQVSLILALARGDDAAIFENRSALADAALKVAEVAGAAGQRTQGEIARGIYATVTSLGSAERWHSEALRLQLSSLALAQAEPMDAAAAEALLGRLRALRQSVGVTE